MASTCPACGHPEADHAPDCIRATFRSAPAVPFVDSLVGVQFGEYKSESRLGEGGMGVVYRGVHPVIGKQVAIKVLREDIAARRESMDRLVGEARAVNAIRHRGIVDIFGFGQLPDGRQYLVMELLDGFPLDRLIAERAPLGCAEALPLLEGILASLHAAHGVGVVHRDLKPSNVFVVKEPNGTRYVKLLDFGLSKQTPIADGTTPSGRTTMMVGTPFYMAPEQVRGQGISPATDLYSFGVLTFEMLTGKLPFVAETAFEVAHLHLSRDPPRPSSLVYGFPPELEALILRLLAKAPSDRPQSAEEVRQALRSLCLSLPGQREASEVAILPDVHDTVRQGLDGATEPTQRSQRRGEVLGETIESSVRVYGPGFWARKWRLAVGLSAVAVALGAVVVAGMGLSAPKPPKAPEPAPVVAAPQLPLPVAPAAPPVPVEALRDTPRVEPTAPVTSPKIAPPAVVAKPAPAAKPDASAVRVRLAKIRDTWEAEKKVRPPYDVRVFDLMFLSIQKQLEQTGDAEAASRGLDKFVQSALRGREP